MSIFDHIVFNSNYLYIFDFVHKYIVYSPTIFFIRMKDLYPQPLLFIESVSFRVITANMAPIMDCDEVYNYWEPLHFMQFQT